MNRSGLLIEGYCLIRVTKWLLNRGGLLREVTSYPWDHLRKWLFIQRPWRLGLYSHMNVTLGFALHWLTQREWPSNQVTVSTGKQKPLLNTSVLHNDSCDDCM